jgi:hypothetical protein
MAMAVIARCSCPPGDLVRIAEADLVGVRQAAGGGRGRSRLLGLACRLHDMVLHRRLGVLVDQLVRGVEADAAADCAT